MKYICEPEKVKQIRKAIKIMRIKKIEQMIEKNEFLEQSKHQVEHGHNSDKLQHASNEVLNIVDRTVVVKEENVLISGTPKQGLKLKIINSQLKHTVMPKSTKPEDRVNSIPLEESQHRARMDEFLAHLERRAKFIEKIKELRQKKLQLTSI